MAIKKEILINTTQTETRVAVVSNGVLQELHIERAAKKSIVGNIYKGKITRVIAGMQAAFVDIGSDKKGFISVNELIKGSEATKNKTAFIENIAHEGQTILVQVIRDELSDKGALLSTEISLAAQSIVYLPLGKNIGISQKVRDKKTKDRLIAELKKSIDEKNISGGIIIRTAAEQATEQQLTKELDYLKGQWKNIKTRMLSAKIGDAVYKESDLGIRVIRDLSGEGLDRIVFDSQVMANSTIQAIKELDEQLPQLEIQDNALPIFDNKSNGQNSIEQQIQKALKPKVELASGANIVIDQTEAMTTIDVNTASNLGQNTANVALETNLEAAKEIAIQIRLRNLSGIIVIDFIDMNRKNHNKQLLSQLSEVLRQDRVKTHLTEISPLGLVEITRKRTSPSLENILCEPCSSCNGRGTVKSAQTMMYEIVRDLFKSNNIHSTKNVTIIAAAAVADLFLEQETSSLANIQAKLDLTINVKPDLRFLPEQYEIVLA